MARMSLRPRGRDLAYGLLIGLGGVLAVWVGLYASGIFPILGYAHRQVATAEQPEANTEYGLPYMLLLEGQTAWFEYDVLGDDWQLTFSVRQGERALAPSRELARGSSGKERVSGTDVGRVLFPVPETGFYSFTFTQSYVPTIGERTAKPRFTITWGASF